jgi:hypothetical protein
MSAVRTIHAETATGEIPLGRRAHRRFSTLAFALAALGLLAILGSMYHSAASDLETPRAVAGTLDLTGWSFERDGAAVLVGDWGFYWNRLLDPSAPLPLRPPRLLALPETWRSAADPAITGRGFATHTLRILLPPDTVGRELGLTIGEVASASQLYVDGRLARQNGRVGTDASTELPSARPGYVRFRPEGPQVELLLQVSNFFRYDGGPLQVLDLGLADRSEAAIASAARLDYMVLGCAGVFAVYCAVLSLGRRPTDSSHGDKALYAAKAAGRNTVKLAS